MVLKLMTPVPENWKMGYLNKKSYIKFYKNYEEGIVVALLCCGNKPPEDGQYASGTLSQLQTGKVQGQDAAGSVSCEYLFPKAGLSRYPRC